MGAILPSERYNEEKNVQQWQVQKVHSFKIAASDLHWQQYRRDFKHPLLEICSGTQHSEMAWNVFYNI